MANGTNNSLDYGYDDNSNLTSLTLSAGAASSVLGYSYDSLNQITALSRSNKLHL